MSDHNKAPRLAAIRQTVQIAEPWALDYVEPSFHGSPDAALALCVALSNQKRGLVARLMWSAKVPRDAYRVFLGGAWEHDHRHVISAAETRRRLAAMFRYAEFPIPTTLGEKVRVWRGTSSLTLSEARRGFSWTINRDVACWFAMRFAAGNASPLVLSAEVERRHIAYHTDSREEAEVVLMRPPSAAIDGNPDDWSTRANIFAESKTAECLTAA